MRKMIQRWLSLFVLLTEMPFDLNEHREAIAWWMVCFLSYGHLGRATSNKWMTPWDCFAAKMAPLERLSDCNLRVALVLWQIYNNSDFILFDWWCLDVDFYTPLCWQEESEQQTSWLFSPWANWCLTIQLSWFACIIKTILLLAFLCICAFTVSRLIQTNGQVFSHCAEDRGFVFSKLSDHPK